MAIKVAEVSFRTQMNLAGNGDGTIAKLGEALTEVSINKPLIKKKEAERGSTGAEYQWHPHICMQAQLSGKGGGPHRGFTNGAAHPSSWPCLVERVSTFSVHQTQELVALPLVPSPLFSSSLLSSPLS